MPSLRTIQSLILAGVLTAGFAARVVTFQSPLLDHHGWRQADTAAIARNFARERFNPFYPQVDQRGARITGQVETGFELFAFVVASISRLAGFHHETGRLLNCLVYLGSAGLLYLFLRDRYGPKHGLLGAGAYALGFPLQLYIERAFMNEASLVFLTFASFRLAQRYLATESRLHLAGLVLCTTLIAVIKFPYLIVWAAVGGLFAEKFGWRALRRWELASMATINLLAAYLWYSHVSALGTASRLTFGMRDKLYSPEIAWSWSFLSTVSGRLRQDVLGPLGLVLLLLGLAVAVRGRKLFEPFALAGFVAYVVILANGCLVHDYYLLPIIPVASVLVALGLCAVGERIARGSPDREAIALFALTAALALSTLFRSIGFHSWYETPFDKVHVCRAGKTFLTPGDRLVFVGYESPDLLFCLDRQGWILGEPASSVARAEEAWRGGATIFVVPRPPAGTPAEGWARKRGSTVFQNPGFEVLRVPGTLRPDVVP